MTKLLKGSDLAVYIKQRQAKQIRGLIQSANVHPKLAIIQCKDDPIIDTYVNLKKRYGSDIEAVVDIYRIDQKDAKHTITKLNSDTSVHGIIVQLPLMYPDETDELVNLVNPKKDVDALGKDSEFEPATPMAILWLLAGYNIDLKGKQVLLVGRGKLVGAPLEKILKKSSVNVSVVDRKTTDLKEHTLRADIIVTATGNPNTILSEMIKPGTVIVDAGVASEGGKTVGDVSEDIYERDDITITPRKGGVGPLTVTALFENVIWAALQSRSH